MQTTLPHLIPGSDLSTANSPKTDRQDSPPDSDAQKDYESLKKDYESLKNDYESLRNDPRQKLIVALDVSTAAAAHKIVAALGESASIYKVGMQLYTAEGPQIVRDLVGAGRRVFLDLKYHDIPNTVASAVHEAAQLGVSMLTVHASGGSKMLRAAVDAATATNPELIVLGVTVLTSMDQNDLEKIGMSGTVQDEVLRLAGLALASGCKGIVTSAREASRLRAVLGHNFALVTPGVRPAGAGHGDQVRVVTPAEAIAAGASHIVVGRPITEAADPAAEARAILGQIG
jgi:orotidine-5'-phosphate decarboxylase